MMMRGGGQVWRRSIGAKRAWRRCCCWRNIWYCGRRRRCRRCCVFWRSFGRSFVHGRRFFYIGCCSSSLKSIRGGTREYMIYYPPSLVFESILGGVNGDLQSTQCTFGILHVISYPSYRVINIAMNSREHCIAMLRLGCITLMSIS